MKEAEKKNITSITIPLSKPITIGDGEFAVEHKSLTIMPPTTRSLVDLRVNMRDVGEMSYPTMAKIIQHSSDPRLSYDQVLDRLSHTDFSVISTVILGFLDGIDVQNIFPDLNLILN